MDYRHWDAVFTALKNHYRRRLLIRLLEHNPQDPVDLPNDVHLGETDRERLNAELYHNHLPKLEELGFIRWDRETNEVVKGPKFDEIRPLLQLIHEHRDELPDGWV